MTMTKALSLLALLVLSAALALMLAGVPHL